MTTSPRIDWILFDWGNVLVEYRPLGLPKLVQRLGLELDAFSEHGDMMRSLQGLTVGALSPEAFVERLAQRFGVSLTRAEVAECFRADVEREPPGIRALVEELRGKYKLAILSNAFFGHWDNFEGSELYRLFALPMSSHLLGAAKPSRAHSTPHCSACRASPTTWCSSTTASTTSRPRERSACRRWSPIRSRPRAPGCPFALASNSEWRCASFGVWLPHQ